MKYDASDRRTGPTATASCCRPATRRCCSTRCSISPASASSSTTCASSASGARARPATRSTGTRRASRSRPVRSGRAFGNAVGIAIAEKHLRARFGADVCDHRVFGICSDGDLMEGISHEAASLAGHLQLGRLVFVYDDNHITIDGDTELTYSDDVPKRFEAYGWHVVRARRGRRRSRRARSRAARRHRRGSQPTLVVLRSHIGYPSPKVQDTAAAHGNPLGADEVAVVKEILGLPADDFYAPDDVVLVLPRGRARGAPCAPRGARATRGSRQPARPTSTKRAFGRASAAAGSRSCRRSRRAQQIATRERDRRTCSTAVADLVPGLIVGFGRPHRQHRHGREEPRRA